MKSFLIFLAGALTGAGIGIFCYKKYEEYKAIANEEAEEEPVEANPSEDIPVPRNEPEKVSYNTPMNISDEDLETEKSQYSACFERYQRLKEHDIAKEERTMATANTGFDLIAESDYHMGDYPCLTWEYHVNSRELFDPDGNRIDDDYSKVFGPCADKVIETLEDPDGDSAIYIRNYDDEEDYEIIAVLA